VYKIKKTKKILDRINLAILGIGIICIVLSALYPSSFLAILGASFIFFGVILVYVTPARQTSLAFITASSISNMDNIERTLTELAFNQKGIYLPPKCLKDPESSLIFIPQRFGQGLPEPSEEVTGLLNSNHDSMFLTPPGFALSKMFEERLGSSFTKIDIQIFQAKLSKILVEDFGIAENLEINAQGNRIIFELTGHIFEDECYETKKLPLTHNAVGCLLSSSLACALAKVTGKALVIENEVSEEKTTKFIYQILEEEE
jgi:hypothetical protein